MSAKKKLEKTFIKENAGKPKQNKIKLCRIFNTFHQKNHNQIKQNNFF